MNQQKARRESWKRVPLPEQKFFSGCGRFLWDVALYWRPAGSGFDAG
jgi:hypothetical protein